MIKKAKLLYRSLKAFKKENLADSFPFVSALLGIAVSEGKVESIEDPVGKYVADLKGTEVGNVSIKDCLQMSSAINFDEDKDMSKMSISMLLGKPAIKYISKLKVKDEGEKKRKYSSINTEIIGEVIINQNRVY